MKNDESSDNFKIQRPPSEKPWQLMYRCHMPEVIDIPSKWRSRAPVSCVWQICIPLSSSSACFPLSGCQSWEKTHTFMSVSLLASFTLQLVSWSLFTSLFYNCQSFSSLRLNYKHLSSSRHNLPPRCRVTSPSPALWHLFTSRGLRPNCYCLISGVSIVLIATQLHRSLHCVFLSFSLCV